MCTCCAVTNPRAACPSAARKHITTSAVHAPEAAPLGAPRFGCGPCAFDIFRFACFRRASIGFACASRGLGQKAASLARLLEELHAHAAHLLSCHLHWSVCGDPMAFSDSAPSLSMRACLHCCLRVPVLGGRPGGTLLLPCFEEGARTCPRQRPLSACPGCGHGHVMMQPALHPGTDGPAFGEGLLLTSALFCSFALPWNVCRGDSCDVRMTLVMYCLSCFLEGFYVNAKLLVPCTQRPAP